MRTLKGWLTTGLLVTMIAMGSMAARADDGIIYGKAIADQTTKDGLVKDGIIYGKNGIIYGGAGIIYGYFGIIYGG